MKKRIFALTVCVLLMATMAEARTAAVVVKQTSSGNLYLYTSGHLRTGWIRVGKRLYYAHRTKSACYPRASLCRNTFRVRGRKVYYFGDDGAQVIKNTRYIKFNEDGSVKYIYQPGNYGYRWNAATRRYEYKTIGWHSTGMQVWPYGQIDWQE